VHDAEEGGEDPGSAAADDDLPGQRRSGLADPAEQHEVERQGVKRQADVSAAAGFLDGDETIGYRHRHRGRIRRTELDRDTPARSRPVPVEQMPVAVVGDPNQE
jgi:hypothetical protein